MKRTKLKFISNIVLSFHSTRMLATFHDGYINETRVHRERHKFDEELREYLHWIRVVKVLLILSGAVSSSFVCFVMKKGTRGSEVFNYSNYFIFHLSLSDLFLRLVGVLDIVLHNVHLSPLGCKAIVVLQFTCAGCGFVILAGISVDRHNNICNPLSRFKARPHRFIISAFWFYAFLVSSGFIFSATNKNFRRSIEDDEARKNFTTSPRPQRLKVIFSSQSGCISVPATKRSEIIFTIYFLLLFLIPLVTMIMMYTRIILFLRQRSRSKMLNTRVAKSNFKAIFMLIVVIVSFLFSWGPLMLVDILLAYGSFGNVGPRVSRYPLLPLAQAICYTSSIFNSIIFAFGNSKFRNNAIRLFQRMRRSVKNKVGF